MLSGAVQSGSPERQEAKCLAEQHVHDEKQRLTVERHPGEEKDRKETERRKDEEKAPLGWIWLIRALLQTFKGRRILAASVGVAIVAAVFIVILSQQHTKPYPSPRTTSTPNLNSAEFGQGVTIRFAGDPVGGEYQAGAWSRTSAEEWAKKTGNKVEYLDRAVDPSAALQQFQRYWWAKSPDIDVYIVDVVWQGILAPHAVDLKGISRRTK